MSEDKTVARLSDELQVLKDRINFFFLPLTILMGLLTAGGVIGVVTTFRQEQRTGEMHRLGVARETTDQIRSEQVHVTFLDASQKTLSLVNDTLALAKESSERAATTMRQRAQQSLDEVEQQAQDVIDAANLTGGFKGVVEDPKLRNDLLECARDLVSIEGYLQLQDIELSPSCLFVKGMERHLAQEPKAAIRTLRQCATGTKNRELMTMARFWIGYERNNLGQFREAIETFRAAIDSVLANSPRFFELKRIMIESRYFEIAEHDGADSEGEHLTQELSGLLAEIPEIDQFGKVRESVSGTMGNVYTWRAREFQRQGRDWRSLLELGRDSFETAGRGLWPLFGFLESRFALGDRSEEQRAGYQDILARADRELRKRTEPRTLASLHEARLVAQTRLVSDTELARDDEAVLQDIHRDVMQALGSVNHSMTVFSQIEKRNVSIKSFELEVAAVFEAAKGARVETTS